MIKRLVHENISGIEETLLVLFRVLGRSGSGEGSRNSSDEADSRLNDGIDDLGGSKHSTSNGTETNYQLKESPELG